MLPIARFVIKHHQCVIYYQHGWSVPPKINDISKADATFSINFCSFQAHLTIGRLITVYSLHLSVALAGRKAIPLQDVF